MSAELKQTNQRVTAKYYNKVFVTNSTNTAGWTDVPYIWTDSRTGVKNPNWKRQIRSASNATTPLSGSKATLSHDMGGHYLISYKTQSYQSPANSETTREMAGDICRLPYPDDPSVISTTSANNLALSRLVKKAREAQTTFQGLTFTGELAETLHMIRNPAKAFRSGLDEYMKTVKKRVSSRRYSKRQPIAKRKKAASRTIADTWLEYSFGWVPLLSDVDSGVKALAQRRHEFRRSTVEISAYQKGESLAWLGPYFSYVGLMRYDYRGALISRAEVRYYRAVKRQVVNDRAVNSEIFGFRPRDFLPTVWELIPYSFLVDYFANIDDIISAWSFHKSNFAWLSRTERKTYISTVRDQNFQKDYALAQVKANNWILLGVDNQNNCWEWKRWRVNRAVYDGSLVPDLTFTIPGLSTKWMNMAALSANHRSTLSFIHKLMR